MRLALWQDQSPTGDQAAAMTRIDQAARAARAAGAVGAAVVVLPEVLLPGYNHPAIRDRALLCTDAIFNQNGAFAQASGCAIVLGYAERDGDAVFNAAVAFAADGKVIARCRKIQLFGAREKAIYIPGTHHEVFDPNGQKAALLTCYGIEFWRGLGRPSVQWRVF
jgi:5-aminopentanamidase